MTPLMSGCENDDTMTVYKNALYQTQWPFRKHILISMGTLYLTVELIYI